jgi:hypothetical protein
MLHAAVDRWGGLLVDTTKLRDFQDKAVMILVQVIVIAILATWGLVCLRGAKITLHDPR